MTAAFWSPSAFLCCLNRSIDRRLTAFLGTTSLFEEALSQTKLINHLNAELNPICHLLALLGAHHIFHVSG